jgi:Zn-dependent protease
MTPDITISILLAIPGFLLAIVCHESAHAWMANRLGDPTARLLGRLSFNPMKHIDPWGTIFLPFILLVFSQGTMIFGYARPVPITVQNFRNPKRDSVFVSLAGPAANILVAILLVLLAWVAHWAGLMENLGTRRGLEVGVNINLMLAAFNLLPIPPLDGSELLVALLPGRWSYQYARFAPWGFLVLMFLYMTGFLRLMMIPIFWLLQLIVAPLGNPFL